MVERWLDVSFWNTPTAQNVAAWRTTFSNGVARHSIGGSLDSRYQDHLRNFMAADYHFGSYHALHEGAAMASQCRLFVNGRIVGQVRDWLDMERAGLTGRMVDTFLDEYEYLTGGTNATIYTGVSFMQRVQPQMRDGGARLKNYGLLIAAYPFDTPAGQTVPMDPASVARRSNPPPTPPYVVPIPWPWLPADLVAHQHTGQGSMPGYRGFLDMSWTPEKDAPDGPSLRIGLHANAILVEVT